MSLDVSLIIRKTKEIEVLGCYYRNDGERCFAEIDEWNRLNPGTPLPSTGIIDDTDYVFEANITHNLAAMAEKAGIYKVLWHPDEFGFTHAEQIIMALRLGIAKLVANPDKYKAFNAPNGWGTYDHFVSFVKEYLQACINSPNAEIRVSR